MKFKKITGAVLAVAMALSLVPTVEAWAYSQKNAAFDDMESATNIEYGTNKNETIDSATDEDWYCFTTSEEAANYTIYMSNPNSSADRLTYRLYSSDKELVGSSYYNSSGNGTDYYKLDPDTKYYIWVSHYYAYTSCEKNENYVLKVSRETEEPDTQATAAEITQNNLKTYKIFTKDDEDWFTFKTPDYNRIYSIYVKNNSTYSNNSTSYNKLGFYVYDAELGNKGNGTVTAQNETTKSLSLEPGKTYYVKFYYSGSTNYCKEPYEYAFNLKAQDVTELDTTGVTVSALTAGFKVNWNKVQYADGYEMSYSTNADMSDAKTVTGLTSLNQTVTNLAEKTAYYVQVRSYVGSSTGDTVYSNWSDRKSVTTDIASIGATTVSVSPLQGGFRASWNAVTYADGYELRYSTNEDMSDAETVKNLVSTNKDIAGLKDKTVYYVQARAYAVLSSGDKLYSDWSTVGGVTTDISSLGTPTVSVSPLAGGLSASWGAVTNADGYEFRYSTQADMNGAVSVALTTTSQSVTNLAENALYYVQVRSYATLSTGEVFYSDWSTARGVTTDIASLGTPVISVYGAAGSIYAEWGAVTNAAGYVLYYGAQPDMSDATPITLTATSQSITGLNVNTIYYVQVRAYANLSSGGVLYSGWSEEKSASTDISSLDTAYISVSALTKGFTANWNAITYANGYEFRYSTKKNMSGAKTTFLTSSSTAITGLTENKAYYVQVRSYSTLSTGQVLYSNWSEVKNVTTDVASLKAPTAKVSAASKGFTVKWGKVKNASGYEIRYSTKKNMKGSKKATVTSKSKKITKLKAKTTYYVQVRAYAKTSTGKKVYSKWSTAKTVKTKK